MFDFLQGRLIFVRICLILAMFALIGIGIASIYASGNPVDATGNSHFYSDFWKKQITFGVAGLGAFVIVNMFNYRRLGAISYSLYGIIVGLLALLIVAKYVRIPFIPMINGAYCWIAIEIGGVRLPAFQPSEFAKPVYILSLAWYLRYRSNYRSFKSLVGPFVLTLLPMLLILLEPDLGTVMLMMPVLFTMLFVAGAKVKHLLLVILLALMVSPVMWHFMRPYQRMRVSSVLLQSEKVRKIATEKPEIAEILVGKRNFSEDKWRRDEGFHLIRSKIAVASGYFGGHGFRRGPFVKYDFLPERYNDFIFSIIAHQWGFAGCSVLIGIYAVIILAGIEIAAHNTDPFGRLLAVGIIAIISVQLIVNVSMTMGLMPITGLTLPLVSYGGSSLVVSMICIGLLNNVGRCRPFSLAPDPFK